MCRFFFAATLGCCSDRRKSVGPSAPIAYATSLSPPNEAVAWPGRRCWMANAAADCPWQSFCKSPSTLQKCKLLITRQLTFEAVRGGLDLCSPSTRLKVNHLCIRYLCFESVRGELQEGHFYASRCHFPLFPSTKMQILCSGGAKTWEKLTKSAQKCRFCARGGGFCSSERKFWYAECDVK